MSLSLVSLLARATVLLALLAVACARGERRSLNPLAQELSGDERERELGWDFDQQLVSQVAILDDPLVVELVDEIGQSIVRQIEPQPFLYRFRVVVDPQLNAFAVPGGFVYLHSGTVLAAGGVDELAGVLGHEIGHVKGHHVARLQADAAVPNLLTSLAGLAAAYATGEPGFALAAQGINVALQLRYTRAYEDEADRIGSVFMARAGYDPLGITDFFERILLERPADAEKLPPYLYSHPQVEDRIVTVTRLAADLSVAERTRPVDDRALRDTQARLALLVEARRSSWPTPTAPRAREQTEPLLARAAELEREGRPEAALALVERAEALDDADPQPPFRRGQLLGRLGRREASVDAYRRAVRLDPSRGLAYYELGRAYRLAGDPVRASRELDQALRRFAPGGSSWQRARRELEQLYFPVIASSGFGPPPPVLPEEPTPTRRPRVGAHQPVEWWGAVGPRWVGLRERLLARWRDPAGLVVREEPVQPGRRPFVVARLAPGDGDLSGTWRLEILLDDAVVHVASLDRLP